MSADPIFSTDDTIVAIATPPGQGGLGVVRISGSQAQTIAGVLLHRAHLRPRHATLARVYAAEVAVDEVIATCFPAPHSYTGQDVVEISAHGSPVVLEAIVGAAIGAGARLAQPGEFTLRAFLNGRRDLVQAEAVGDLIAAVTPMQARAAFDQMQGTLTERIAAIDAVLFDLIARLEASLDFPDEGYHFIDSVEVARELDAVNRRMRDLIEEGHRGRVIREGATVVIAGRPNVGKSSLFNALVGADRAIVTDVAGTTRDLITETVDLDGLMATLVDTAGARQTSDPVEREGVARAEKAARVATALLVVVDQSCPFTQDDRELLMNTVIDRRLVVINKTDMASGLSDDDASLLEAHTDEHTYRVSATNNIGIKELRGGIVRLVTHGLQLESPTVTNIRHLDLMIQAQGYISNASQAAGNKTPEEFVLTDLHAARIRFDEIVGVRSSEDVLTAIFQRFCIGK